jgi:hypothetical protein
MNLQQLVAGDTLDFTTTVSTYPPSDGWTLVYRLVPRDSAGHGHHAHRGWTRGGSIPRAGRAQPLPRPGPPASTAGRAGWKRPARARVSSSGGVEILANPATVAAGYDNRGHARKVLDAIEAVLEQRASVDQQSYSINGRHLARTPIAELLRLRSVYRAQVAGEDAGEALNAGLGGGRKIQVRL